MGVDALRRAAWTAPALPDGLLAEIVHGYGTPGRHYHTVEHLLEVAAMYTSVAQGPGWDRPLESWLALLYHDVIYEVGRPDNEARSADFARESINRWRLTTDVDRVGELIGLTAAHGRLTPDDVDRDSALFVDCDMAILGAESSRFTRYEQQVRAEWEPLVGAAGYDAGRRDFLVRLLASPTLYLSSWFREWREMPARHNLERALAELADS